MSRARSIAARPRSTGRWSSSRRRSSRSRVTRRRSSSRTTCAPTPNVIHPDDRERVEEVVTAAPQTGTRRSSWSTAFWTVPWIAAVGAGAWSGHLRRAWRDGGVSGWRDLRHHCSQSAEERLAFLAYHDPLTGLPNRMLFREHLDVALRRAARAGGGRRRLLRRSGRFEARERQLRTRRRRRPADRGGWQPAWGRRA